MTTARLADLINAIFGFVAIALSVVMLERARGDVELAALHIGATPATLYAVSADPAPVVVVAHGFAGSRQLMEAYSFTFARAGYAVISFDFQGHGRHPQPMGGDVTKIDGTTARLVAQTREVIDAARTLPIYQGEIAILGHSMASDVIIRAAIDDGDIEAVIALSSFSASVTDTTPNNLLMISGAAEARLRDEAVRALKLVDPQANEGETATSPATSRRAAVAPRAGHIGVLFSGTGLREARSWLDQTFGRDSTGPVASIGLWIIVLLGSTVFLFRPIASLLPQIAPPMQAASRRRFLLATLLPAFAAPILAATFYVSFLPVLVADYLLVHLALLGAMQLAILRPKIPKPSPLALALLLWWGLAVFGLLLDRYAASFVPNQSRLLIIALLSLGAVPAMLADSALTQAGHAAFWRRTVVRLAFLVSLVIPALMDPEGLGFILIAFPVLILFGAVHGFMGRWVGQRAGATTSGIGLGLILAWAIGVSFPLFAA